MRVKLRQRPRPQQPPDRPLSAIGDREVGVVVTCVYEPNVGCVVVGGLDEFIVLPPGDGAHGMGGEMKGTFRPLAPTEEVVITAD